MRSITTLCGALLIMGCMTAIPAHAQNGVMGNVQRFLGNDNSSNDRDAYEQGRRDEMAQQQADRERRRAERQQYGDRNVTQATTNTSATATTTVTATGATAIDPRTRGAMNSPPRGRCETPRLHDDVAASRLGLSRARPVRSTVEGVRPL